MNFTDAAIELEIQRQGLKIEVELAKIRSGRAESEFFLSDAGRCLPQSEAPYNPNAGVVQAFPKGRWT